MEVPLFPLEVVVFPGMTVPLHIFEERYKRLVRVCLGQEDKRFVIALASHNAPIRDTPVGVAGLGAVVQILSVEENTDGTFELLVHGQERCRVAVQRHEDVLELDGASRPLLYTELESAPLERTDPNAETVAAWDAIDTFRRYAKAFFASGAQEQIEANLPDDPLYQASFVCANIRVPLESRQVLLEAATLQARFELATKMMNERLDGQSDEEGGVVPGGGRSSGTA